MDRITGGLRAVSDFLSGAVGVGVFLALAILGVIGTILTATDLLNVDVDPGILIYPAALLVALNVVYREVQRRREAEQERDAAKAALDAKPDEAATLRTFLRLHDYGPKVLEPFNANLEDLNRTMPQGEALYREWVAMCIEAIEAYRPSYALRFRQSLSVPIERGAPLIVGYKDDDGERTVWVDMERKRRHQDLVAQSMKVLADIIAAG